MDIHGKGLLTMLLDALDVRKQLRPKNMDGLDELRLSSVINFSCFLALSASSNIVSKPLQCISMHLKT